MPVSICPLGKSIEGYWEEIGFMMNSGQIPDKIFQNDDVRNLRAFPFPLVCQRVVSIQTLHQLQTSENHGRSQLSPV